MQSVATIGMFDGVHCGHRFLLGELVEYGKKKGLRSLVITFSKHPRTLLHQSMDGLITGLEERKANIEALGVDKVVIMDFGSICDMTAKEFLEFIHEEYEVSDLLMGYNHHFGSDRLSSFEQYQQAGKATGIHIEQISASPEMEVSSSIIRKALLAGDIETANRLLSYEFSLTGKVIHGKGLGRQIGYPTANLSLTDKDKIIPKAGVYIARTDINGMPYTGVMNIGSNPTVQDDEQKHFFEIHLLDYEGDLYGDILRVELLHRLRDEKKFDSIEELRTQIAEDIRKAEQYITSE